MFFSYTALTISTTCLAAPTTFLKTPTLFRDRSFSTIELFYHGNGKACMLMVRNSMTTDSFYDFFFTFFLFFAFFNAKLINHIILSRNGFFKVF